MNDFKDIKLIASGGINNIQNVITLKELNMYGTIVGKAIYENTIDLQELSTLA